MILCKWSMVTLVIGQMNANLLKMIIGAPFGAKNRESWPPHIPPKQHWIQEQACKCLLQCRCGDLPCLCLFGQMSNPAWIAENYLQNSSYFVHTLNCQRFNRSPCFWKPLACVQSKNLAHLGVPRFHHSLWLVADDHWKQKERCDVIKMMVEG